MTAEDVHNETNTLPRLSDSSPDGTAPVLPQSSLVEDSKRASLGLFPAGCHSPCNKTARIPNRTARTALSHCRSRFPCTCRSHDGVLLMASIAFCFISRRVFVDWTPEIHIPYDIATTGLIAGLVSRLLVDIAATRARRFKCDQVVHLQIQLFLVIIIVLFNTAVMRQILRISGHVSSATFIAVYASIVPSAEKKTARQVWMPWVLFGAVIMARRFGCLDCCYHPELKKHICNGTGKPPAPCRAWEDSSQTQVPIVAGIGEAIFSLFVLWICSTVMRAWQGRHRNGRWRRRMARCRGKRLPTVTRIEEDVNDDLQKDGATAMMISNFDV